MYPALKATGSRTTPCYTGFSFPCRNSTWQRWPYNRCFKLPHAPTFGSVLLLLLLVRQSRQGMSALYFPAVRRVIAFAHLGMKATRPNLFRYEFIPYRFPFPLAVLFCLSLIVRCQRLTPAAEPCALKVLPFETPWPSQAQVMTPRLLAAPQSGSDKHERLTSFAIRSSL